MKQTRTIMGMPITVEIVDLAGEEIFAEVFDYFRAVDEKFSTYKTTSEISRINRGELQPEQYSPEMKNILGLSEQTKADTGGFFDIRNPDNQIDPSGLVKGWAILAAAKMIQGRGLRNYYVDAGGDIQAAGHNSADRPWTIGIKNPFNQIEIVKVIELEDGGVATSGSYIRGAHIYNPHQPADRIQDAVSLTVIGPDIYEADRFATAAFAMGTAGINFIERLAGLEGYLIDSKGIATATSGFSKYVKRDA